MKKFINLCYHKDDFDMDAEWYVFPVSHGIGVYGWTVKTIKGGSKTYTMLSGSLVTPRCVFRLQMKKSSRQRGEAAKILNKEL
jgi:hypothetical protein